MGNWASGEPNSFGGSEECVGMWLDGTWNDFRCNSQQAYVCKTNCGNGEIDEHETCDDNNRVNGDGCSSTCTVESGYACTEGAESVCTNSNSGLPLWAWISISVGIVLFGVFFAIILFRKNRRRTVG